ncbi:beta-1,4 N-acetylgalactosaminyltransferase 1-like [Glandiceps talaboti]
MSPSRGSGRVAVGVVVAALLIVVFIINTWSSPIKTSKNEHQPPLSPWKQLPYDETFTDEVAKYRNRMMTQGTDCSCMTIQTSGVFFGPLDKLSKPRRDKEMKQWKYNDNIVEEPIVFCRSYSPISYVGGGLDMEPLQMVCVVGITLHTSLDEIQKHEKTKHEITITSTKKFGVIILQRLSNFMNVNTSIYGNGTNSVLIKSTTDVDVINSLLKTIIYRNTYYDIDIRDILEVKYFQYNVNVHIHIKRQRRPKINNVSKMDDINKKVTIVTKTFERYYCLKRLIDSVGEFYPGMTILVADDSENVEKIDAPNVKQYLMPFAEGWFPGRNLLMSQVRTKYFVWVDDDYIFTENTKLENFLEKLEDPEVHLDIVGAFFQSEDGYKHIQNRFYKTVYLDPGNEDGDCLRRTGEYYRVLEKYPQCMVVDMVTNFFMAKTEPIKAVGFDPFFQRIGHMEFFLDGLGLLTVATCKDVFIIHKRDNANNQKYVSYRNRKNDESDKERNIQRTLFKNNLQCFRI